MSTKPLRAADVSSLYRSFGTEATYTPNGGSPVTGVRVILEIGGRVLQDEAGRYKGQADLLIFNPAEVSPARDATVEITETGSTEFGETWILNEPDEESDAIGEAWLARKSS